MKKTYIDTLKEVLADKASLTPEKLQSFMGLTMQYLNELRVKMTSKEPKDREEAMSIALELKDVLEVHMSALSQVMGIDLTRISEMDLMERMNDSEKEVFASAKEQFTELKSSMQSSKKEKLKSVI